MKKNTPCRVMVIAILLPIASAQAQTLTDPTRPPSTQPGSGSSPVQEEFTGPRLQSILLSSGRKLAVINGTVVSVGGMIGEARVVKITETQVVLKTGAETEVLSMYPGIEKRPVKRTAARRGESK